MTTPSSAWLLLAALLAAMAAPASAQIYRSDDLPPPTQPQALPFPEPQAVPTESTAPILPDEAAQEWADPAGADAQVEPWAEPSGQVIDIAPLAEPEAYVPPVMYAVQLRGTNKVNARTDSFDAVLGSATTFGNLEVIARACWQAPPDQQPENAALLDIWERKPGESAKQIFVGWMFSSSPSLSSLQHPVYDITVLKCLPLAEGEALP